MEKGQQKKPKLTIREIYELLNKPDITLNQLDDIDQQLTEQYLGYYFNADIEKQLQQVCDSEKRSPEISRHLLELVTGKDINSIYAMPKECRFDSILQGEASLKISRATL